MAHKELENTEAQLRPARMATISKPSFWLFIGLCFLLYICNKITTPDTGNVTHHELANAAIIASAFIALLLNLIVTAIKNSKVANIANLTCYILEAGSLILIVFDIV
jgi:hypothetical protein